MELNEFQGYTISRSYEYERPIEFCSIALAGEVGELLNIIKKIYLRGDVTIPRDELALEMGDVLHYLARLADFLGWDLETVATMNIAKLNARYA